MSAPVPECIADPARSCHLDLGSHGPREIHDHPVSGVDLDLDAVMARQHAALVRWPQFVTKAGAATLADLVASDVPALVAEVRRLRLALSLRDPSAPTPPDLSPMIRP